jgi:hypothetical protein
MQQEQQQQQLLHLSAPLLPFPLAGCQGRLHEPVREGRHQLHLMVLLPVVLA